MPYDQTSELIDAIRVALASDDLASRDNAITNLLAALIGRDPVAAVGLAEGTDVDQGREELLRHVAQIWSARDPAGALAWAGQLPDADERNAVLTDVALQIARTDPAEAVGIAERHGLDDGTGSVLSVLVSQWAEKDLDSALTWAGDQPAGERRNQCVARIAFVQSRSAPQEAANLVVHEIPPGAVQDEAAISVLHQWMLQDFAGAAAWVAQFPESPLKERAGAELTGAERYLQATEASAPEDTVQ